MKMHEHLRMLLCACVAGLLASCGGGGGGGETTPTFGIGGNVAGLSGQGLVLTSDVAGNVAVAANGTFTFQQTVPSGTTYNVSVLSDPSSPAQVCKVTKGSGTVADGNVVDVTVQCSLVEPAATVLAEFRDTVAGLVGNEIKSNGPITADGGLTSISALVKGFAFCVPANLFALPLVSPTPGNTIYRCPNGVALDFSTNATTLTVTLDVPGAYVDFDGSWTINLLGIETTTSFSGAAVITGSTITVSFALLPQPNGSFKLGAVTGASVNLGSVNFSTSPSFLGVVANLLVDTLLLSMRDFITTPIIDLVIIPAAESLAASAQFTL